jgi:RHS repeat-associated protein
MKAQLRSALIILKQTLRFLICLLCAGTAFEVLAQPNVRPYCASGYVFSITPDSVVSGGQISVSFWVANYGSSASSPGTLVLYLTNSANINPTTDYALTATLTLPSIPAFTAENFTVSAVGIPGQNTINSMGGAGTFYVGLALNGAYQGAGEGCDRDSLTITIPPPDLVGINYSVQSGTLIWGNLCQYQFGVENLSGGNASPFNVNVYLSTNQNIGTNDYLLSTDQFANGIPGLTYSNGNSIVSYSSISGSLTLPPVNPFGNSQTNFYVGIVISNQAVGSVVGPVTIENPQPQIQVSTSTASNGTSVAFGNVANDGPGNAVGTQTVTIINTGMAPLTVSNISLSGSPEFSIVQIASSIQNFITLSTLPRPIADNGSESWVITLQFDPTNNVSTNGTLTITSSDPNTPILGIPLTGTGVPVPQIAFAPGTTNYTTFGSAIVAGPGGSQVSQTISFENTGSGPLTVNKNGISLLNGTNFRVISVTSTTQGAINLATGPGTIAGGGAEVWNVVVQFAPIALGVLNDGLQVASNDPKQPNFVASLQGTGLSPMQLQVLNSTGTSNIVADEFPGVDADGPGKQQAATNILLRNYGQSPLTIAQNGLSLSNGTHFLVQGIVSSRNGPINLAAGPATIAGSSNETWTVTVVFDPTNSGTLTDTLKIQSNDPTNSLAKIALSGQGLSRPHLSVSVSVPPTNDLAVPFGTVLNGTTAAQTVTLMNLGTEALIVGQNGISLSGSAEFSISNVISSTRGIINLSSTNSAMRTIATAQNEIWTVNLVFDAETNGPSASTLSISSNDTNQPDVQVALTGTGETPTISITSPSQALDVSAGSVFNFTWQDSSPDTNSTISIYLDATTNPATGLIPIASGLSASSSVDQFSWYVNPSLVGTNYYIYATISDGQTTQGTFAPGTLTIDPMGAFQLLSSTAVTGSSYAYQYVYNGRTYQGLAQLLPGNNMVTVSNALPGGGYSTYQFNVDLVSSLTQTQSQQYNALNQLVQSVDGNGIVTTYTYNQMGQLIQRSSSNGAVVTYTYDVLGRRTSMTDYTGTTYYGWDDLDRLIAVTNSNNGNELVLQYQYDLAGNRIGIVYPDGETIQYTYDGAGRMLTTSNATRSLLFTYTYNATNGLLMALTRPNGINTLYSYDGMGNVTNILHQHTNGTLVANYYYGLDAAGKATNFVTTLPGNVVQRESYAYDQSDRLIQAIYATNGVISANSPTVNYTYDRNGNRLTMTTLSNGVTAQTLTYQYGNDNRLLNVTDQNGVVQAQYNYDSAGNIIQEVTPRQTTLCAYDERNLLISIENGTNQVLFNYNGDGQRIAKTVNGMSTTFILDPSSTNFETVEEIKGDGSVTASYTLGANRLASCSIDTTNAELQDRLGSVRFLTDFTSAVVDAYTYDAFGSRTIVSGTAFTYGFDGERVDYETGLIFLRTRYYDPATGKFISRDPLGIVASLNSYSYCGSDPLNTSDPSGMATSLSQVDLVLQNYAKGAFAVSGAVGLAAGESSQLAVTGVPETAAVAAGFIGITGGVALGIDALAHIDEGQIWQGLVGLETVAGDMLLGSTLESQNLGYVGNAADVTHISPVSVITSLIQSWNSSSASAFLNTLAQVTAPMLSIENAQTLAPSAYPAVQSSLGTTGNSISGVNNIVVSDANTAVVPPVGGVLLDDAATLVGSSLSEFSGAMYDPVSGQFVFLGTNGPEAVTNLDLDYLYTALQAVYGSAVPPYVTLLPSATAYTQWTDYGTNNGVFAPGESGGFILRYNPIWSGQDTTVNVTINSEWSGSTYSWTAQFNCIAVSNVIGSVYGHYMQMIFTSWITPPPAGITLDTRPWVVGNFLNWGSLILSEDSEDTYRQFTLTNGSAQSFIVTGVQVVPAVQQRQYGGRIEGTKLGWVMLEADRVMKCLSIGTDNLTGTAYNSSTVPVPGYENMPQLLQAGGDPSGDIRFWFTPNQMTLEQDIDPVTGRATIVFSTATVLLNTESFILGLPQLPEAAAFAGQFTSNYDAFAALSFPCHDPNDPAGTNIIQAPIFKMLKDVMEAVSLARFCRDNNIPVDTWWLNSWTPPVAFSLKSTPTIYDQTNGMVVYGGVQIYTPNAYVPSATAQDVAEAVQASRFGTTINTNSDLQQQVWSATNTPVGTLTAVAASTTAAPQDGNIRLVEKDLTFASPGALPFQFARYYESSWLGNQKMGAGWRYTRYVMEFQRPSWYDETHLMLDANANEIWTDSNGDTRLRSGAIRVVDLQSGSILDFNTSLVLGYAVNNTGNPIITLSGLNAEDLPTFSPGQRQSGATLVQLEGELDYLFTTADGSQITFDSNGRLLSTQDRYHMLQTYNYDANGDLTNLVDSTGQAFNLIYDSQTNFLTNVFGPANEQIQYGYSNGCLVTATHVRSGATVNYQYNTNGQFIGKAYYNGLNALQSQPDLKGRPTVSTDMRSNSLQNTFTQNSDGSVLTTQTVDPMITDTNVQPWQKQFDRTGRLLNYQDATGAQTQFAYEAGSLAANYVTLPITNRPTITIQRNGYGQPTQITDPGNIGAQNLTATYNPTTAQLNQFSDAAGRVTQLYYNASNSVARIHRTHNGQNADVGFNYSATGALHAITNQLGQTVATYYRDAVDRVTNAVDGTGVSRAYNYDSLGRLSQVHDPRLSGPVQYSYDNFDRVTNIQYPVGSVSYAYDPIKGWLTSQTDILGRTTTYVHNQQTGDVLQSIEVVPGGSNLVTTMTYNRFGELATVTLPNGQTISYNYDSLGRPLGSSTVDTQAPGAPQAIQSNHATNGIPTVATIQVFTWGAPASDSGIAGYSYAFDQTPHPSTNTTAATATWSGVTIGTHTFQVMAQGNNGLWGPAAVFNLIVLAPPPYITISRSSEEVVLSWTTNSANYYLQTTTNLSSGAVWTYATNTTSRVGASNYVTVPITNTAQFFRLQGE